ncbi:MAG: C25 family cysteine peptidase [Anaerolineae bacterium]|jgi:hypothetical protein
MIRSHWLLRTVLLALLVTALLPAQGSATPIPMPAPPLFQAPLWQPQIVDDSAIVGAYASLALGVEDRPHISYFDETNSSLKVAIAGGAAWQFKSLDSNYVSACQTAIALDAAGQPHVSYCGMTPDGAAQLRYAHIEGSTWQTATVSTETASHTSLALDVAGRPHIAYLVSGAVRYASRANSDWSFDTVPEDGAASTAALALDAAGQPHIAYRVSGAIKYAVYGGSTWSVDAVVTAGAAESLSLALDSDGGPHISYYDAMAGCLTYATLSGAVWSTEPVDCGASSGAGRYNSLALSSSGQPRIAYEGEGQLRYAQPDSEGWAVETVDSSGDVGRYPALTLDAAGYPHIAYQDGSDGNLKYAAYDLQPPAITSGPGVDSISSSSARVFWQTEEASDSRVRYGQQAGVFDQQQADGGLVQSHSVTLSGLQPATLYHFVAESTDGSGNTVTSAEGFLSTHAGDDSEPPVLSPLSLSAPEEPFGYHSLRVPVADDVGVDRVVFRLDDELLGTAYAPSPAGAYQFVVAAPHLGMTREEFYSAHTFAAVAYDHAGGNASSSYSGIPWATPLNGVLQILAPDPQHTLSAPGGTTPPGTTVKMEVYASEYEWTCDMLPFLGASSLPSPGTAEVAQSLPASNAMPLSMWPPWCHDVEVAVDWVKFLIDDELRCVSMPPTDTDLLHTCTWNASNLGPGTHQIKVVSKLSDDSLGERTRLVQVVPTDPQLDVHREIVRVNGNYFRIQLLVENLGTAAADAGYVVDNLTGFQAIQKTFDAIGSTDDYYMVATDYVTATRRCDVTVALYQNTGGPLTLEPGDSALVEYLAVPVLYANPWPGQYTAGEELVQIHYRDTSGWTDRYVDRPTPLSFNGTPLATEVNGARAASDYLIVSNASRLFMAQSAVPSAVNRLLSDMAELAMLKKGILGDATYSGPVMGPGQTILSYDAAYVRFLLDTWGQGMLGSDGIPGHHPQNGYVLLVGESDILPAKDLSKAGWTVHLSDLWYGDTNFDWPNPERVVGRIIGFTATQMSIPIQTSINVHRGKAGYGFDRDQALVLAGRGDGRTLFELNAFLVAQVLDDEFNSIVLGFQKDLEETSGWDITDWFRTFAPDQDVIYYRDHSGVTSWGDGSTVVDTGDFAGNDALDFGGSKPFVFGCACLSGNFSGGSLAEAFLQGGAAVYIGATEVSDRLWNNNACTEFYQRWVDSPLTIGQALRDTKRDITEGDWWSGYEGDRWAAEYNLYGDPKYGGGAGASTADTSTVAARATPLETMDVAVPGYEVTTVDGVDWVTIPGGSTLFVPGQPVVPIYTVEASIPEGYQVQDVTLTSRTGLTSGTGLNLPPAALVWDSAPASTAAASTAGVAADGGWWPAGTFDWEVVADAAGGTHLLLRLAPFYYNAATTGYKFYQTYEFDVSWQASDVSIELLGTDRLAYAQDEPVQMDLWLKNEGETQDVLVEAVVRSGDSEAVVDGLPLRSLTGLTGLATYTDAWDSSGLEAGDYILEVTIRDDKGAVLDRERTEFALGLSYGQITGFTATPQLFQAGEPVQISLDFENSGTVPISGTVQLEVQDGAGQQVAAFSQPVNDLAPNQTLPVTQTWDTAGVSHGTYRITAHVLYDAKSTDRQSTIVRTWMPVYLPSVLKQWP